VKKSAPQRPWLRPLLGALAVIAVAGVVMSYLILVRWTNVIPVEPTEVDQVFAASVLEAGGGAPFIEIADSGVVIVHREQEKSSPKVFETLTIMVWAPNDGKVLRVDCPHWFVRLKTASSFNLGTMISTWRKDWGHLDLNITYDDLVERGPALLLDHRAKTGARILLWTSANGQ